MNIRRIVKILGALWLLEALAMVLSALVCVICGERGAPAFLYTAALLVALGLPAFLQKPKDAAFFFRDGFVSVALAWISISVFGALPFVLSGEIPSFTEALFESVSGFTTTGASVLDNVERMSRGMLFWCGFTHWIGGMGVLVLALALLPSLGARSVSLLQAEFPGPAPGKLVPKLKDSARILYTMYIALSALEYLLLVIAGMPPFDALIHTFGTASTGGFSSKLLSVGHYNSAFIEAIIGVFLVIFGMNHAMFFLIIRRKAGSALRSGELRVYLIAIALSIAAITPGLLAMYGGSLAEALRHSSFQVASLITSTGFVTTDFTLWPVYCRVILLGLMVSGACSGSTSGGVKLVRLILMFKAVKREIHRILHPRASMHIMLDGALVKDETINGVQAFFALYMAMLFGGALMLSFDGHDLITSLSASLAMLGNIGQGMGLVGPTGSFSIFSGFSKIVMSFLMLAGRLEIYPLLVILIPSYWKKGVQ